MEYFTLPRVWSVPFIRLKFVVRPASPLENTELGPPLNASIRITSYNVCYTKLLRDGTKSQAEAIQTMDFVATVTNAGQFGTLFATFNSNAANNVKMPGTATAVDSYPARLIKSLGEYGKARYISDIYVITSYSIHYTKLYDEKHWCRTL